MAYINQAEIDAFIVNAKAKIAKLGLVVADATLFGLPYWDEMHLTHTLGALITSLEDRYLDWEEQDVLIYIHYYNDQL